MMNSTSLIRSILGSARGSIQPLVYAVNITAERIFEDRVAEDELKLCDDVCTQVAGILSSETTPKKAKSIVRSVERWANKCWDGMIADDLTMTYIGKSIKKRDDPRKMVIYLATYAYFDKPYYQMVVEQPEMFTGQK